MATDADDNTAAVSDPLLAAIRAIGRPTAVLLFDSGWMLRRTDTVNLISDAWMRQRTAVDVAIPLGLAPIRPGEDGEPAQFAVPVMLLPKVRPTLMQYEFRCGNDPLSLPTRYQACLASYAALLWAAQSALGTWPLPEQLRKELRFVAIAAPEYAVEVSWQLRAPRLGTPELPSLDEVPTLIDAENALVAWWQQLVGIAQGTISPAAEPGETVDKADLARLHNRLAHHELASWLLRKLATHAPVIAHVQRAASGRQTVCLAYDENLFKSKLAAVGKGMVARNGWLAYTYVINTPYVGAASYHFEFITPKGVEAIDSQLIEQEPAGDEWAPRHRVGEPVGIVKSDNDDVDESARPRYDYTPFRGDQVHLYRVEERVADGLDAVLHLRASRTGFISGACLAAGAIALILIACAVLIRPLVSHGTGAQTMLLLVPGVLAALIARVGDHALMIRMLQGARRTLLFSGALAFLGAAMLAFINTGDGAHAEPWHRWFFILLAVAACWQACALLLARTLPRHPEAQGFLEQRIDGVRKRAEKRAQRRARRRQLSLRVRVTADAMTSSQARRLVAATAEATRLPLALGPEPGGFGRQQVTVHIVSDGEKPLLLPTAKPTDRYAAQELTVARRLAHTIRWLGEELPEGFRLEIRWAPFWSEARRRLTQLGRGPRHPATQDDAREPSERAPQPRRLTADNVAAAARSGGLLMNHVHVIDPYSTGPERPLADAAQD